MAASLHDLGAIPLLIAHIGAREASPAGAAAALGHIIDAKPDAVTMALQEVRCRRG